MVAWRVKDTDVFVKTLEAPLEPFNKKTSLVVAEQNDLKVCVFWVCKKLFEIMLCAI